MQWTLVLCRPRGWLCRADSQHTKCQVADPAACSSQLTLSWSNSLFMPRCSSYSGRRWKVALWADTHRDSTAQHSVARNRSEQVGTGQNRVTTWNIVLLERRSH